SVSHSFNASGMQAATKAPLRSSGQPPDHVPGCAVGVEPTVGDPSSVGGVTDVTWPPHGGGRAVVVPSSATASNTVPAGGGPGSLLTLGGGSVQVAASGGQMRQVG